MHKTKKLILYQSLLLFNNKGIVNVALRDISGALNISIGNLQYHFKKREDIIEALYYELVSQIDKAIEPLVSKFSVDSFFDLPNAIIRILFLYRFFLIDFVAITRNNKKIKRHYAELSKKREQEFLFFVDRSIAANILRKPVLKDEYLSLYKSIEILGNFWFSNCLVQQDNLSQDILKEYSVLLQNIIFPYLTEHGRTYFSNVYDDMRA